jgi:hypothetical protein
MKKIFFLSIFLFGIITANAQTIYRTQTLAPNIRTLQAHLNNDPFALPVLTLNGDEALHIQFDEMSHEFRSFSYRVFHANADWTASSLNSAEYLRGFSTGLITESKTSMGTLHNFTNYRLSLPNNDMNFMKSGNYVLEVYEDGWQDNPVLRLCFSVVAPRVGISATIRGNTDTEINRRMQQLDFEIDTEGYRINDPQNELRIVVRQNNRTDNEVQGIAPTFIRGNTLSYINNRALIFEGGNEYHSFDISSVYSGSNNVERVERSRTRIDAFLFPNAIQPSRVYRFTHDVNGRFIINLQGSFFDLDTEADYVYVHFTLPRAEPFFDGQIYIGGEYNYNLLNDVSRMQYDFNLGTYFKTLLLKQGGYNYQFWFLPKNSTKASVERVDGSFWQTRNEYTIYVYHRPWGERYDKLVGVRTFEN